MNGIIKKKLNLLVHLARIDGSFHKSERDLIIRLVGDSTAVDSAVSGDPLAGIDELNNKEEILYLALKLVQADEVITPEELTFCKTLAVKLGFPASAAEHFAYRELSSMADFARDLHSWKAAHTA